jgi:16S rRNA (cytosine967-C5)-methyltransferase
MAKESAPAASRPSSELSDGSAAAGPPRLRGRARALALEIAAEARAEWAYTTDLIATAFRKHRELGSSERRLVAETVYGLVRWERRLEAVLDDVLGRGRRRAEGLSPAARGEIKLLLYELRLQGVPAGAVAADLRRLLGADPPIAALADEGAGLAGLEGLEREAVRLSFPTWLVERLAADLGLDEAIALGEALNRRAPLAVRANGARVSREALAERLAAAGVTARPTRLAPSGLVLETRVNAFGLDAFKEGLFEVMDEGSQLVAEAVAPPPGGRVVDACAGAGGKTLALGALLAGKGRILALDVAGKKLEELRRRARRAGLNNVVAREVRAGGAAGLPAEAAPGAWDRVLVDAPCSGIGTLRRNPEARWRLTPREIAAFPPRQLALLVTYAPLVAPGGRLVYATCTVLGEENERVVERFLAERPEFEPVPLKEIWGKARALEVGDGMTLRLLPHRHDTDGFFCAALRRRA